MRLRFWGVRGALAAVGAEFQRVGGNTPCVEVRDQNDELLVLDAGIGARRRAKKEAVPGSPSCVADAWIASEEAAAFSGEAWVPHASAEELAASGDADLELAEDGPMLPWDSVLMNEPLNLSGGEGRDEEKEPGEGSDEEKEGPQ